MSKSYEFYKSLPAESYETELKIWYKEKMGKELKLENPETYNEKIQWLKLYDVTSLKTKLSDKYLVRDWVEDKIGKTYLTNLLGVWDCFEEIDFEKLPEKFVIKANHGCGYNIVVKDKKSLNLEETKEKMNKWLKTNFAFSYGLEMQYYNIKPKIIIE